VIFNHERKAVWQWDSGESLCPDCEGQLVAKRGEIVCWHWAHAARRNKSINCHHEETAWHLAMKMAYLDFDGWNIEVPVEVDGKKYRIDAYREGKVREFVHSLSPHYVSKHLALKNAGMDVLWIFDGFTFGSARWTFCMGSYGAGYRRLLKPAARRLFDEIGGLVHFSDFLLKQWRYDVFFPCKGEAAESILTNYHKARTEMRRAA
jgi:hypothetical protein